MTDRYKGFVVALKDDIRSDDAQKVTDALAMIQGVISVAPITSRPEDGIAEQRVKQDMLTKIYTLFK